MKTMRQLLVLLVLVISVCGAVAAGLPQGRIGDTREQCVTRFGAPLKTETSGKVDSGTWTDGEWIVTFSFSNGRADQVDYRKAAGNKAEFPQSEIDALLKLNGGDRPWTKADAKRALAFADGTWITGDDVLRATLYPWPKRLVVATRGNSARTDDPAGAARADAQRAWRMGILLGSIPGAYLDDQDGKKAPRRVAEIQALFRLTSAAQAAAVADPALALPELPAKTGERTADYDAVMKFVGACNGTILKAIRGAKTAAGEPRIAPCFEMGLALHLWPLLYRLSAPEPRAAMLEGFAKAAQASQLPAVLWEPVDAKARAKAPQAELEAAIAQAIPAISKYLDGQAGEADDPKAAPAPAPIPRRRNPKVDEGPVAAPPPVPPVLNPEPEVRPGTPAAPEPNFAVLTPAHRAWLTGLALGRVGLEFMLKHEPTIGQYTIAQRHYDETKRLLAENKSVTDAKVSFPELAAKSGDPARDRKEIAAFLDTCGKAFIEKLGVSPGAKGAFDPGGFFWLGLDAQRARLASAVDPAAERAEAVRQIEKTSRYCRLPETLWQPALKAQDELSQMDRDAVLRQFIKDVSTYLEAQEKKPSPAAAAGQKEDDPIKITPDGEIITPQTKVEKDGTVIVPGLGGMKFLPNGDIVGSDGKKLYDGAKKEWAPGALGKGPGENAKQDQPATVPAVRIGETPAQLTARLGQSAGQGSTLSFRHGDWRVFVELHGDRAERIVWRKPLGAVGTFTSETLYAMAKIPDADLQAVRRLHAGEQPWVEIGSNAVIVRRKSDIQTVIADFKPDAKALADKDLLHLPDITWKSGSLRCNFKVSEFRGALDKVLSITTQEHENRQRAKRPAVSEE